MAQDTSNRPEPTEQTDAKGRDNRFHYYSGGEVKELADTRPSQLLYVFYGVVIVGAIFYFLFGGALGPKVGGFKPVGGSQANLNSLQAQLDQRGTSAGITYASVDLSQLPVPNGQNVTQAVAAGAEVYQSYCIGCHGPNQDGNGVNAGSLNPKPRNLRDSPFMQAMSYQRITTSLHKGVPGTAMPRWENLLTEREIGDVIAYVFSLTAPPPGSVSAPASAVAEKMGAQSGGSKTFVSGIQNSPKPITPAIGGNPAAHTETAPPSQSGPTPAETTQMMQPSAAGAGASKPLAPSKPTSGGESAAPPLQLGAPAPRPAAPIDGGSRTPATTATPNSTGSGTGTGM